MSKTTYVTIRIDYEDDGRFGSYEADGIAADMVVARALAHNHTIENGISIENIENCGINQ
jgi:hypothetical protein